MTNLGETECGISRENRGNQKLRRDCIRHPLREQDLRSSRLLWWLNLSEYGWLSFAERYSISKVTSKIVLDYMIPLSDRVSAVSLHAPLKRSKVHFTWREDASSDILVRNLTWPDETKES